jgi:outer membrane protein TolC
MKKQKTSSMQILLILLLVLRFGPYRADTLTLEQCHLMARQNYPLAKQQQLISKSKEYSVSNISKGFLPQISINGQATYQSDVMQLPIKVPGITIPEIEKDQYKVYGEINQPLTDVFTIKHQKSLVETNALIQEQNLEVELYKLKERVNQLYFGSLLIDEQIVQIDLLKKDIQSGIDKINAATINGTALKSNADVLKAELLKAEQKQIELNAARKSYLEILGLFINKPLNETTSLQKPENISGSKSISRPELLLFDNQKKAYDVQNKLITAKNLPRVSLFLQSGYAKPAFNMFSNEFDFYYIGGLRFNWPLTGLYTMKKERSLLTINQNMIDVQRETFLFNTDNSLKQQSEEMSKYQKLIDKDSEIITLRTSIKTTANTQLENGTITSNDYLREVIAEDQARQNLSLHKIQLLMAGYNYKTISGN